MRRSQSGPASTSTRGRVIDPRWSTNASRAEPRRRRAPPSESTAQEQIERRIARLTESGTEIDRADQRVEAEEDAALLQRAVETDVAALVPDVARLERDARIHRHIEEPLATAPDLAVIEGACDGEVPR